MAQFGRGCHLVLSNLQHTAQEVTVVVHLRVRRGAVRLGRGTYTIKPDRRQSGPRYSSALGLRPPNFAMNRLCWCALIYWLLILILNMILTDQFNINMILIRQPINERAPAASIHRKVWGPSSSAEEYLRTFSTGPSSNGDYLGHSKNHD